MSGTEPNPTPAGDPEPLIWRLIPLQTPPLFHSAAVLVAALSIAVGLRLAFMDTPAWGAAPTYFPALIVITLHGGMRIGWIAFGIVMLIVWAAFLQGLQDVADKGRLALFAPSAALTVMVAGALRTTLVRLRREAAARHRATEQLRESEARFRTLADSAPALLWVSRPGGSREFVNTAYVEFVGGSYQDALDIDWRTRLHPEDLHRILREQAGGEGALRPFSLEARYSRADGEWRWLKSFSQPRFDPGGDFAGFAGIAFDVTDAKRVEADLQHINELLEERVQLAVAERDEAQSALVQVQKLEALGQLTGGVAHDFNNLLTVIIGALDIVLRGPEDAARTARLGRAALDAAQRGERLTRQLLAFSRREPVRAEICRPDALIRESDPLYRRTLGERYILDLSLGAGDETVRIDAAQFDAALMNLLANARDAMSGGGVVFLSTALVHRESDAADLPAGDYVSVSVQDTGAGMDEATVARMFEPFFSTKPVGKGTGLGLSQVYGFARQSGGSVGVDSAPGRGTTVTLLLPTAPATADDDAKAPPGPAAATRPLAVLLVEDDSDVAALAEAMLRELGHEVIHAEDAAGALACLRERPRLGLLMTDVAMPGGRTGVDLAREATAARPDLPVLLCSGYTGEALASAEDAPWPLLRKPYTLDGLAHAIDAALDTAARPVAPTGV
ncbi:MAG: ATP-binding protein [Pseudomonadota bacterium]